MKRVGYPGAHGKTGATGATGLPGNSRLNRVLDDDEDEDCEGPVGKCRSYQPELAERFEKWYGSLCYRSTLPCNLVPFYALPFECGIAASVVKVVGGSWP